MKGIAIAILLMVLCYPTTIWSQEIFEAPPSRFITKFHFKQLTGGIIIVRGQVDNIPDTLNFVFDTGSGGISLDSSTVEEFHIKKEKSDKTIRGIAGMKKVDFAYHHSLKLPNLKIDSLDFHINDYDLLTSVYGVKIDGIIGFSFLRRYIVRIDYDSLQLEIYSPGNFKYPRGGYVLHPNFTTMPLPRATMKDENNVTARFIFDTGAGLNALLSKDFVEDSNFISKHHRYFPTQTEGLGGKKLMDMTLIKEINIGPYHFRNVPIYVFEDDYNVTSYPLMGGLIGNDILRRFNVILNYPDQLIHLKPNSHYIDNFDYSYTGLGIYLIDGDVTVVDIIKDSPGEKAGFKNGDIIFSIENNFTKNIQSFKTALQNAGARVKVVVLRNNQPVVLYLNIRNINKKK
jgi:hypothetical protein